jgi:TolA-binding protein
MEKKLRGTCFTILLSIIISLPVFADKWDEVAMRGEEAMNAGKFKEAITHFENIVKNAPTFSEIFTIKFELGWCYYAVGDYTNAVPLLTELNNPKKFNPEIAAQALYLLADSYGRIAGMKDEKSPDRSKFATQSIELFDQFLKDYPNNAAVSPAIYGRAYAFEVLHEYDKAEAELNSLITKYPNSSAARDGLFLMASIYSERGVELHRAGKKSEAENCFEKARKIFGKLAEKGSNLAMANNALFSIAETYFNAGLYQDAIKAYRDVFTKKEVIQNLESQLGLLRAAMAKSIAAKEDVTAIKNEISKINGLLISVKDSPDIMLSAYIRIADIYFKLGRPDEARTIASHIIKFVQGEQKKQIMLMLVRAYVENKEPSLASETYNAMFGEFGTNIMAGDQLSAAIGQLFLEQGDVPNAIASFAKSIEDFPKGQYVEEAFIGKISAEYGAGMTAECFSSITNFLARFPNSKFTPNALYLLALSSAAQSNFQAAVASITTLTTKYPNGNENLTNIDEAYYQKGNILLQAGKPQEAIKEFNYFTDHFPNSSFRPYALLQIGNAEAAAGNLTNAANYLKKLAKQYPTNDIAPLALFQIGAVFFQHQDIVNAAGAFLNMREAYPQHPLAADASFWLGWIEQQAADYDGAAADFLISFEDNPNSPQAPQALQLAARLYVEKTTKLGALLTEARRDEYRNLMLDSTAIYQLLLELFPETDFASEAVTAIAENYVKLIGAKMMTQEEALAQYQKFRERQKDNSFYQAQIAFSEGSFLLKIKQKELALKAFKGAMDINPDVKFSPKMLIDYADALADAKQLEEAAKIYTKVIQENVADATLVAPALYGLAEVYFLQGKNTDAETLYEKITTDYAWFEKDKPVAAKLAAIKERNGDFTAAAELYKKAMAKAKGEGRPLALLGYGRCFYMEARSKTGSWQDKAKSASETFEKLGTMFEAYPEFAAEGWWMMGQTEELLGNLTKARECYQKASKDYRDYTGGKKAADRLNQMSGGG